MAKIKTKPIIYKPNLIRLLSSFSPKEIIEFDKFIRSPFFNNQSTLIRLFSELKKYYPAFDHTDFTKEKLFAAVNPESDFDDTKFRKYYSNLCKLAEEYLNFVENDSNPERKKHNLLEQYDKRNLNEFYERTINELNNNRRKKNFISNEFFLDNHLMEESKLIHFVRNNNLHLIPPELKSSHNFVILHLLMITTVYRNILLVNKKSFKDSEIFDYLDEFLKYFDFESFYGKFDSLDEELKTFVELCRYDIMLSQDSFNKANLEKMKMLVLKLSDSLNDNLFYTFVSHLNIYYLINIEKGDTEYDYELFENYKFMIDKGIYISDNIKFINYSEYRTILAIALKIKKFDWAKDFIKDYGNGFKSKHREDYINYSYAFLNYEMKKYEESLKYLSLINLDQMLLKLDVNILNAMIYYELNYYDSAVSTADSFRRFLKENDVLSLEVKNSHLNFINSYKAIVKHRESNSGIFELTKLKEEIENFSIVRRKKWLLEKIDDLVNRISKK